MKVIQIKLIKEEVLHLRRGGKIDHFYENGAIRVQLVGPPIQPKSNNK